MRNRSDRGVVISEARLNLGKRYLGLRLRDGIGFVRLDCIVCLLQCLFLFVHPGVGISEIGGRPVCVRSHYRFWGRLDRSDRTTVGAASFLQTTRPFVALAELDQECILERVQWLI